MYLSSLNLENFRSYTHQSFSFDKGFNLIIGNNGTGKTNILEAIYLLSTGKSFRAAKLSQVVKWGSNYASVVGTLNRNSELVELETQIIADANLPVKSAQKRFLINKNLKTRKNFLGVLKSVVFQPDDIRLVTGSPSRRRQSLDAVFTQSEWRYAQALAQYNKALKHRNELLDLVRIGKSQKAELFYWDQSLIKNAEIIRTYRQQFINHVNQFWAASTHPEIQKLFLEYHQSVITADKLTRNYPSDLDRGYTSCGPHLDDFHFMSHIFTTTPDKSLSAWGSRGQQRLAVLGIKLAEIDFIETRTKEKPILLLDDIFSELDTSHQELVVNICRLYQSIITSADSEVPNLPQITKIISLKTA
ncbi:DNA replication and repair protein RecF [Patescibacteria group bacterium]|nr:DNA replication and repair protein RecF [Patescibacteria group bacterium]